METGHISVSFSMVSVETVADTGSVDLVHTYHRYESCLERCFTDCACLKLWYSSISDTPFVCLAAQLSEFPRWTSSCVKHLLPGWHCPVDSFHRTSSHVAASSSDTQLSSFRPEQ